MDDRHSSGKAATPPPSIIPLMSDDYNLDFITQDLNYNHVIDMFRVSSSPTNNSYYYSNNNNNNTNNNNNNNNPAPSIYANSGNLDPLVFSRDVSDNYSGFFPMISDHNNDSVFNQFNNNNYSPTMSCSNNNKKKKNPLVNQSFSGFEGETAVRGEEEDDDDEEEEEEEDYMEGEQSSAASKGNNNNNSSGSKKGKMDRSRTLISERKRRGRMKEKLYALRALVPNITKMDKASIVGDAVLYVQDMQMQSKNLKSQIEGLESSLKAAERSQGFADNNNSSLAHFLPVCRLILQLDVRQIEDKEYYVKVVTNKGQGVAASLYKALDSLTSFIIRNSSLSTLYEQFIFTFTLNVAKCKEEFNLPNMKVWISGALLNQGFEFQAF